MDIWYDTEFLEDGRTILPISIGMVREDGEELYLVNDELLKPTSRPDPGSPYLRVSKHQWLMANVVPHLPLHSHRGEKTHGEDFFHLDPESPAVLPMRLIRAQVRAFVLDAPDPTLWAWYGSYDHVMLCQLFGKMIHLPEGFPMVTHDVMTIAHLAGGRTPEEEPAQNGAKHNALADARHTRTLHAFYSGQIAVNQACGRSSWSGR